MEGQGVGLVSQSPHDMVTHPSNETQNRERVKMYARLTAWTILIVSLFLICVAAVYLRNTTIGFATAFAGSLIIYECVLVLRKATPARS
jgi:hypothetical protein